MKKISTYLPMLGALVCLSYIGCEEPQLPESKPAAPAAETAPPVEEPPMVAGAPGKELPETEVPVTDIPRKFLANDPVPGRRSRREAREGSNVGGLGTAIAGGLPWCQAGGGLGLSCASAVPTKGQYPAAHAPAACFQVSRSR